MPSDAAPCLSGKVAEIGYQGDSYRLSVAIGAEAIKVKVPPHLALALQPGAAVELTWASEAPRVLGLDGDRPDRGPLLA